VAAGRPLYQHTAEALGNLLAGTAPGTYLPSEPDLARQMGVSRATLREAMRSFEERGLVVRRQGVGTYVTEAPQVIDTGLEVLESIETLARRMGLSATMGAHQVRRRAPEAEEARALGLSEGSEVVEVARVMLAEGRPVAHLVDAFSPTILPDGALEHGFTGSVLDLLLRRGEPALDSSRTEITAVSATGEIARSLSIQRGDVLLRMEAYLFTKDNQAVVHSLSTFLPGTFRFHVVRRVGRHV
jgi:GntR family transcriptional regulator